MFLGIFWTLSKIPLGCQPKKKNMLGVDAMNEMKSSDFKMLQKVKNNNNKFRKI